MSKYVIYYTTRKTMCRELAEHWAKWSTTVSLSESETEGISKFFYSLARRFGLIGEFKELGII